MSLPSSGQLSINDIRVELGQAQANSSLRSLSNIAGFSAPDAISEFYGYGAYNTFAIIETPYANSGEACADPSEDNLTLYFEGSGGTPACPALGVTLYTDSSLTTTFDGRNQYFKSQQCGGSWYYILDTGLVEGNGGCK